MCIITYRHFVWIKILKSFLSHIHINILVVYMHLLCLYRTWQTYGGSSIKNCGKFPKQLDVMHLNFKIWYHILLNILGTSELTIYLQTIVIVKDNFRRETLEIFRHSLPYWNAPLGFPKLCIEEILNRYKKLMSVVLWLTLYFLRLFSSTK